MEGVEYLLALAGGERMTASILRTVEPLFFHSATAFQRRPGKMARSLTMGYDESLTGAYRSQVAHYWFCLTSQS
jgi:hypothetical protein